MALSVTSSQREQTSLRSQAPRLPRSNVCSTPDLENPSASVHLKRFSTPSLTLKFLCAAKLNPRGNYPGHHAICHKHQIAIDYGKVLGGNIHRFVVRPLNFPSMLNPGSLRL